MRFAQSIRENLDDVGDDHFPGYGQVEAQDHEGDTPDRAYYVNFFAKEIIGGEAELEDGQHGGVCIDVTDLRVAESLAHTLLAVVQKARAIGFPDQREALNVAAMTFGSGGDVP